MRTLIPVPQAVALSACSWWRRVWCTPKFKSRSHGRTRRRAGRANAALFADPGHQTEDAEVYPAAPNEFNVVRENIRTAR